MAISKVEIKRNGQSEVLIDLTADTVTSDKLLSGYKAHGNDGTIINGTCDFDANTSDATGTADTMQKGVTAYVKGEKITGTLEGVQVVEANGDAQIYYNSTGQQFTVWGTGTGKKQILSSTRQLITYLDGSLMGDATAADIVSGKTFTSQNGLKVTGTMQEYDSGFEEKQAVGLWVEGDVDVALDGQLYTTMLALPKTVVLSNIQKLYVQFYGEVYEVETWYDADSGYLYAGNMDSMNTGVYNGDGVPFGLMLADFGLDDGYFGIFADFIATEARTIHLKIAFSPFEAIHIQADSSIQLNTAGKYCGKDIVVEVESGGGLPDGFSALESGVITYSSATYAPTIQHNLGVTPNFFMVTAVGSVTVANNSGYMVGFIARKQPFESNAGYYTTISITSAGINSMSGNAIKTTDIDSYFNASSFMPYGFFKAGIAYRWVCGVLNES